MRNPCLNILPVATIGFLMVGCQFTGQPPKPKEQRIVSAFDQGQFDVFCQKVYDMDRNALKELLKQGWTIYASQSISRKPPFPVNQSINCTGVEVVIEK